MSDFVSALNETGLLERKKFIHHTDLIVDEVYRVLEFQQIKTKFGVKAAVRLDPDGFLLFLPQRFRIPITDEDYKPGSIGLVKTGVVTVLGCETPLLSFRKIDEEGKLVVTAADGEKEEENM